MQRRVISDSSSPGRRNAGHRRAVQHLDVVLYHPLGAEPRSDGSNTFLDHLKPAARNAVEVPLVKERHRFLLQLSIELLGIMRVLYLHIRDALQGLDAPAVCPVVAFLPPPVKRAEMQDAV